MAVRRSGPLLPRDPHGRERRHARHGPRHREVHLSGVLTTVSLLDRIDEWARRFPDRVAHSTSDGVLTWGELARRSDALAGALRDLTPGAPVVLRGHKEPEMLVGFL